MNELKVGIMKNKELAEWFGLSERYFVNHKKAKLEELKNFACFVEIRGGVNIVEIIRPRYEKQSSNTFKIVEEQFDNIWSKNGLDSCKRVSLEMKDKLNNELSNVADGTVYEYTRKVRTELYGVPFQHAGTKGSCIYTWCKKTGKGASAHYELLTPEEEEIKQNLIKKYYGNTTEKQLLVKAMVEAGEIKKEEAWEVLEEMVGLNTVGFFGFLQELSAILGCTVVKGTLINKEFKELEESAF